MIENELSWLVKEMPDLAGTKSKGIEQHYLSASPDPLRIRATDNAAFEITKKVTVDAADATRKDEINIPLTATEFAELKTLSKRSLAKTRHYLPLDNGLVAELDVFHGPLEGFVKVEVEFPDETARAAFVPPAWFGRDISAEKWAKNSKLAEMTFAELIPLLGA
jgi:CYTH domain-containing protein